MISEQGPQRDSSSSEAAPALLMSHASPPIDLLVGENVHPVLRRFI